MTDFFATALPWLLRAGLYSQAALFGAYLVLAIYGAYEWKKGDK